MSAVILLFGATGQLGKRLAARLETEGYEVTALDRAAVDFATVDSKKLEVIFRAVEPVAIINAAAYTAVDKAEQEPELAQHINKHVPWLLAKLAKNHAVPFVHFSTDYVFEGKRGAPYAENAPTHPLSVYGRSKLEGEEAVLKEQGHVFRLQWVFDCQGKNFFVTMQKLLQERDGLKVVADQLGAPSFAVHIAQAIARALPLILEKKLAPGLYHLAAQGFTSWHGFTCAIAQSLQQNTRIDPLTSKEYPLPAMRPKDTRLDCSKLALHGIAMPHWREGLKHAIDLMKTEST